MLNEKKIRLMTKLSLLEEQADEQIKMDKYYKSDYIRFCIIKTLISVTIGYLSILLLIGGYWIQEILEHSMVMDYQTLLFYVIVVYFLVLIFYGTITGVKSYFIYEKGKKVIKKYKKGLKSLRLFYKEGDNLK